MPLTNTIDTHETKHLIFKKMPSKSGKTYDVSIENKKGEYLGLIHWFGAFRKYTLKTIEDIEWDDNCLLDVTNYLRELMNDRARIPS